MHSPVVELRTCTSSGDAAACAGQGKLQNPDEHCGSPMGLNLLVWQAVEEIVRRNSSKLHLANSGNTTNDSSVN